MRSAARRAVERPWSVDFLESILFMIVATFNRIVSSWPSSWNIFAFRAFILVMCTIAPANIVMRCVRDYAPMMYAVRYPTPPDLAGMIASLAMIFYMIWQDVRQGRGTVFVAASGCLTLAAIATSSALSFYSFIDPPRYSLPRIGADGALYEWNRFEWFVTAVILPMVFVFMFLNMLKWVELILRSYSDRVTHVPWMKHSASVTRSVVVMLLILVTLGMVAAVLIANREFESKFIADNVRVEDISAYPNKVAWRLVDGIVHKDALRAKLFADLGQSQRGNYICVCMAPVTSTILQSTDRISKVAFFAATAVEVQMASPMDPTVFCETVTREAWSTPALGAASWYKIGALEYVNAMAANMSKTLGVIPEHPGVLQWIALPMRKATTSDGVLNWLYVLAMLICGLTTILGHSEYFCCRGNRRVFDRVDEVNSVLFPMVIIIDLIIEPMLHLLRMLIAAIVGTRPSASGARPDGIQLDARNIPGVTSSTAMTELSASISHSVMENHMYEILSSDIIELSVIGAGGQGRVVSGMWRRGSDELPVALKFGLLHEVLRVVALFGDITNRHIVRYYGVVSMSHGVALVMERLEAFDMRVAHRDVHMFATHLASALDYLHVTRQVVHGDIKPSNVLYDPKSQIFKLTDFGVSAHTASVQLRGGTMKYMAPEQLTNEGAFIRNAKTDMYSYGLTVFVVASGRHFTDENMPKAPGDAEALLRNCCVAPDKLRVVSNCLSVNPHQRWCARCVRDELDQKYEE